MIVTPEALKALCSTSVPQLCKNKLSVTFKGQTVKVSNSNGNALITGFLDPVKYLFMVPINNRAEKRKAREKESPMFAGTANQWIETNYNGVVRPILFDI